MGGRLEAAGLLAWMSARARVFGVVAVVAALGTESPRAETRAIELSRAASEEAVSDRDLVTLENPTQGFRILFRDGAVQLTSTSAVWDLVLSSAAISGLPEGAVGLPLPGVLTGQAVDYRRPDGATEEFVNSPAGLRHRILLPGPPPDATEFSLTIATSGSVTPKLDDTLNEVVFLADGTAMARYRDLTGTDAAGLPVPVRWDVDGRSIRIVVQRTEVSWPIAVEALLSVGKGPRGTPDLASATAPEALVFLAPPANDNCTGAEAIPAAGPFPHLTAVVGINDGTSTGDPVARPGCVGGAEPVSRSVWYRFTPAASGIYTFTSCAESGLTGTTVDDTVLAVYTSSTDCTGTFTQVAGGCDDDSCNVEDFQSFLPVTLSAGLTYYVVAWSLGDPTVGNTNLQLLVTASFGPNPPANDACGGAEIIPPAGPFPHLTAITPDVGDATTAGDPPSPLCSDGGTSTSRSIWYEFTPSASGEYLISACSGDSGGTGTTLDDPILAIYTSTGGCGGPFTEIPTGGLSDGCDDDSCAVSTFQPTLTTQLSGGTTYYLVVSKVGSSVPLPGQTAVQLRVGIATAPANDTCADAVPLTLNQPVSGSTAEAGDDTRTPNDFTCYPGIGQTPSTGPGRDVAYSFTAPSTDTYSFRITEYSPALNPVLYVSSACPATAPPATVTCLRAANRNISNRSEEVPCVSIEAAATVYAFVDEHAVSVGSSFVIEVNRCVSEVEPNSVPAQAGPLSCPVEGGMSSSGESDFFSLGSPAVNARVFALAEGMAASTTDFDLRATTFVDTIEYDDLDLDTQYGALSPTLNGVSLPGGSAFLRVSIFSALAVAEPYRLYAVVRPPLASAVIESEPNGSTVDADLSADGYLSGTLAGPSPSADEDYFAVDAVAGDMILVGLDGDPLRDMTPLNARIALLDSGGTLLVEVNDPDQVSSVTSGSGALNRNVPRAPAEGIAWRARTSGRYYVRVAAGSSSGTTAAGDYLLSINRNCATPDDDGDGVLDAADCAPTNGGIQAAPGLAGVPSFDADKQTITWGAATGGSGNLYDVLRGSLASLPVGPGAGDEVCFNDLTVRTLQDPTDPAAGQGFTYLIRGSNTCGTGSYGFQGIRGAPGVERTSTTCP